MADDNNNELRPEFDYVARGVRCVCVRVGVNVVGRRRGALVGVRAFRANLFCALHFWIMVMPRLYRVCGWFCIILLDVLVGGIDYLFRSFNFRTNKLDRFEF